MLILLCSFLCIAQSKLPLKGTITYHQSICKCFGQCEYDEHEGMSFMKKKKRKLWVNYPFVFSGVYGHCGWNVYSHSSICWSLVPICCYTCPYPQNHHPISPPCCPMSDLSTVCIFFSLCTLFFEGSSDINYTDKNPKVSARS